MNGYYHCKDPLAFTRVKQQNFADPYKSHPPLQREYSKPPTSAVWNVVSGLVQALSDARDELLTLLTSDCVQVEQKSGASRARLGTRQSSKSPSRSPSRSPCRSPCRSLGRPLSAPSDLRRSKNPILTSVDCGRIRSFNSSHNQKSHTMITTCYTPPVSFGMNLQFDNVRRGRSPPTGCRRPAGRYQSMTLNQRGITPHGLEYVSAIAPGYGKRKRHCTATRFAELIKAETYQLRERRLAQESTTTLHSRPSWY